MKSYMLLQATMDVRLHQPHITVRYNKAKNPDSFLQGSGLAALGTRHPPFYNDEVAIKHMMDWGYLLRRLGLEFKCDDQGCREDRQHQFQCVLVTWGVELVLLNGVNRYVKSRLPVPETGDPGTSRRTRLQERLQDIWLI